MEKWINKLSQVVAFFGKSVSWLSFVLVIIICLDVISRYLLNFSVAWVAEIEWHIFGLLFLFGSAYALNEEKHVRVDLFYQNFSKREKAQVNVIGTMVFLIPWCLTLGWYSLKYSLTSFAMKETSPDPGGLGAFYFIKMAIPLAFLLLFFQGLIIIFNQFNIAFKSN
ncbi:MAG: TRAP transporter small permease subunit [Bacteroidota bacterium]|jgi:TRAP-type mannitol/chloroaromatic compound transport system permease small subunit